MSEINQKVHKFSEMLRKVGLSQQEVADHVGVSRPVVTHALDLKTCTRIWRGVEELLRRRITEFERLNEEIEGWKKDEKI
tara:strand:+ start:729 stop:968 length:240 start_codon:yes stop_codon:yes gene_type:complete